jgi:hypothetical protein
MAPVDRQERVPPGDEGLGLRPNRVFVSTFARLREHLYHPLRYFLHRKGAESSRNDDLRLARGSCIRTLRAS